jgi:hypothetical protein
MNITISEIDRIIESGAPKEGQLLNFNLRDLYRNYLVGFISGKESMLIKEEDKKKYCGLIKFYEEVEKVVNARFAAYAITHGLERKEKVNTPSLIRDLEEMQKEYERVISAIFVYGRCKNCGHSVKYDILDAIEKGRE